MKRSTLRRREHKKRNDQLPPFGETRGPRFWISRDHEVRRIQGGHVLLNRGTGKGTERAIAREKAR